MFQHVYSSIHLLLHTYGYIHMCASVHRHVLYEKEWVGVAYSKVFIFLRANTYLYIHSAHHCLTLLHLTVWCGVPMKWSPLSTNILYVGSLSPKYQEKATDI